LDSLNPILPRKMLQTITYRSRISKPSYSNEIKTNSRCYYGGGYGC